MQRVEAPLLSAASWSLDPLLRLYRKDRWNEPLLATFRLFSATHLYTCAHTTPSWLLPLLLLLLLLILLLQVVRAPVIRNNQYNTIAELIPWLHGHMDR